MPHACLYFFPISESLVCFYFTKYKEKRCNHAFIFAVFGKFQETSSLLDDVDRHLSGFNEMKKKIPTFGGVLLDTSMRYVSCMLWYVSTVDTNNFPVLPWYNVHGHCGTQRDLI